MTRRFATLFSLLTVLPAAAAEGGGHAGIDPKALPIFGDDGFLPSFTNSVFVALIVCGLILWFVRRAMKQPQLVPGAKQNVVEYVVEFLYGQTENILGPKLAKRSFPLLATIFLYVTIANWFGLLPGVGTVGFNAHESGLFVNHVDKPLLRPATADMNLTLGIALCAFIIWFIVTMQEVGLKGFIVHMFGPKGGLKGFIKYALIPIFLIVGLIEVVSIAVRPISLSMRLYGNIFAGENLLHTLGSLGEMFTSSPFWRFVMSVVFQLPFYFLEILVGILQGMVFAMLCTVYLKLSTTHDEEHAGEHAAH